VSRRHFGTDGIRGRAGEFPLDGPTIYALGRTAGQTLGGRGARALVGTDTRESCSWIAAHLVAGLEESDVSCRFAGVLPTPAVAHLTAREGFTFGAVISASHNPYQDNGIKFFSGRGFKLPDETESRIERALEDLLPSVGADAPAASLPEPSPEPHRHYLEWLIDQWEGPTLDGVKIVLDCANGAAYQIAPELFGRLGADVVRLACAPDGKNINERCGSLHTDGLARAVAASAAHMGFAFDGDADRCLAVTPSGRLLDGDYLLYRAALHRSTRGRLRGGWVVGTVMSNLWLEKALAEADLRFFRAPVGDRYVLECLKDRGGVLGGEPSGHILFLDQATTGDGLLTALTYAMLARDARGMEALAEGVDPYPQVLANIRVARRLPLEEQAPIQEALAQETAALGSRGRIVLRYSGTEPLLRLMVEAATREDVDGVISRLGGVLRNTLGEASAGG